MPQLPILSAKKLIKALAKIGYEPVRQKGSHMRLAASGKKSITVPDYKSIDRSLLIKILRDAELSTKQFIDLF